MRFSYAESMTDPANYPTLVQAAEAAGFDSFVVPDSICYPEYSDSTYPYTAGGQREFLDDKPFIEPFTLIPALAAVTEHLRFTTFVLKLTVRNPVLVAKSVASVAVMSGNRLGLGIGTSPWPEDYQVTGVPWAQRGARTDEMITVIRGLLTGDYTEYHGDHIDVPSIKICPVPVQPVPILVGGHSAMALDRAARLGDGWMHAGGDPEALDEYLRRLQGRRDHHGRAAHPFEIHVISTDAYDPAGLDRLAARGVTDVIVGFRADSYAPGPDTQPLSEKLAAIEWYATNVIAPYRGQAGPVA